MRLHFDAPLILLPVSHQDMRMEKEGDFEGDPTAGEVREDLKR